MLLPRALLSVLLSLVLTANAFAQSQPPRLVSAVEPVYPPALAQTGGKATVRIEFTVEADGSITNPTVLSAPDEAFAQAALEALGKSVYAPGTSGGEAISFRFAQRFEFLPPEKARSAGKAGADPLAGAHLPATPSQFKAARSIRPATERVGASARLDAGLYEAVLESPEGTFFLAPAGGFTFTAPGVARTSVGGVFVSSDGSRLLLWHADTEATDRERMLEGGFWNKREGKAKSKKAAPQIEKDFTIPSDFGKRLR